MKSKSLLILATIVVGITVGLSIHGVKHATQSQQYNKEIIPHVRT